MRTTRTRTPWVGLIAALALVVAACGGDGETADTTASTEPPAATAETVPATTPAATTATTPDTTTASTASLVVWADANRAPVIEAIAPAFAEATGVDVTVEVQDFGQIKDLVSTAAPAGEGPDLFIGAHDWTGELVANGIVEPLDLSGVAESLDPQSVVAFTVDGTAYGLPVAIETVGLYRNTDLVPDAPATFEELGAICEGLEGIENCIGIPGGADAPDAYHMYFFVSANGGYIFDYEEGVGYDPSDVGLDNEGAVAGATFLADQVATDVVGSVNYDTAKNLFLEGSQPFWVTGPWELGGLAGQDTVSWEATTLPTIGGNDPAPMVGAQGMYLSAFSEQQVLAQSFLLEYVATAETMQAIFDADARPPVFEGVDAGDNQAAVDAFLASVANGYIMPNIPQMGAVWGPLGDNLLLLRNAGAEPAAAMGTAAEAVRAAVAG